MELAIDESNYNRMDTANKTVHYSGKNALRLEWPAGLSAKYGVVINFDQENELKYEVRVTRLKPSPEGLPLFQIERDAVFINEMQPDLLADRLAYLAGKVFYPLTISVDQNGGFESIYNHQEIYKRWQTVKERILNDFDGDLVTDYLSRMEQQLSDADKIDAAFSTNDWFIHTFFKPLYKEYGTNYSTRSVFKSPLVRDLTMEGYLTEERLGVETNDFGAVELVHEGNILPMEQEFITSGAEGIYAGRYILHPKSKRIISVVSNSTCSDRSEMKAVNVKIFLIPENGQDFDYDFTLSKDSSMPTSEMVILDGPAEKRGFWDKLFN